MSGKEEKGEGEYKSPPSPHAALHDDILVIAQEAYKRFRCRCFWHCPHDLAITVDLLPFVIKGLRLHGGREGFLLAGRIGAAIMTLEKEKDGDP